jgi:hypothetical protein
VHEGKAHSNFATWPQARWKPRGFFLFPPRERLLGTFVIVDAAEEGDVVVLKADIQKQTPQVFLRRNRLSKDNGFAAAMTVTSQIQYHFDCILKRACLGIVWKRPCTSNEILNADQLGREACTINPRGWFFGRFVDFLLVLKVTENAAHSVVGTYTRLEATQTGGDIL